MRRLFFNFGIFLLWFSATFAALAQNEAGNADVVSEEVDPQAGDSLVVSLLTCSEGPLVYELYGHTALRVREFYGGNYSDWVFNYGTFSFRQPHFMWRFVLGKTDYRLAVEPFAFFFEEYRNEGRAVREQRLNLTQDEARRLREALALNLLPENVTYRYNFFYDNCVTRALQKIEEAVSGTVVWPEPDDVKSLRDVVHEFSEPSPWNKFGQDLLLGAEADREADVQLRMFAPIYAERYIALAVVRDSLGVERPLANPSVTLLPADPSAFEKPLPLRPLAVFGLLFALILLTTLYEWRNRKYFWGIDALLYLGQGLVGCILTFLLFFSSHPAVGSNFLCIFFNPLPLLLLPWFLKHAPSGQRSFVVNLEGVLVVLCMLVGLLSPQKFPPEVWFILATLALRVASNHHFVYRIKRAK